MTTPRRFPALLLLTALVLPACGGSGLSGVSDQPTPTRPSTGDPALDAVQAQIDAFMALPEDERLAQAAQADLEFELFLASREESGLEAALGGPDATRQALTEQSAGIVATAEQLKAEPLQAGFRTAPRTTSEPPGIGGGLFGTYMLTAFSALGAADVISRGKVGTQTKTTDDGELTVTATADSVEISSVSTMTSGGGSTAVASYLKMSACPDETGQFNTSAVLEVESSAGPSAGQKARLDVDVHGALDDSAHVADSWVTYRMRWDGLEGGSFVDVSLSESSDHKWSYSLNGFNWFTTTPEHVESARQLAGLFAGMVRYWVTEAVAKAVESGACVRVAYTLSDGPTGLAPNAPVDITVSPVAKSDSRPTGGTVTATLSAGKAAVAPSGTPVAVDAKFGYTAPPEANATGQVTLEARSKRGVGRAVIDFDTKKAGYVASGGTPVSFSGTVPDLTKPFTLQGAGPGFTVDFSFTPTDASSGALTYTGSGGGVTLEGAGTYTISGTDPVLTLSYDSQGCATPGGCRANSNQITLTRSA